MVEMTWTETMILDQKKKREKKVTEAEKRVERRCSLMPP